MNKQAYQQEIELLWDVAHAENADISARLAAWSAVWVAGKAKTAAAIAEIVGEAVTFINDRTTSNVAVARSTAQATLSNGYRIFMSGTGSFNSENEISFRYFDALMLPPVGVDVEYDDNHIMRDSEVYLLDFMKVYRRLESIAPDSDPAYAGILDPSHWMLEGLSLDEMSLLEIYGAVIGNYACAVFAGNAPSESLEEILGSIFAAPALLFRMMQANHGAVRND